VRDQKTADLMTPTNILSPGLPETVREAQAVFRSVMMALARPGTVRRIAVPVQPPGGMSPAATAIALALCDFETPVWLDDVLSADEAIVRYLRFHTGAPITPAPAKAHFAFVSRGVEVTGFDGFSPGTLEYPDRSATLVIPVDELDEGRGWTLTGPGIDGVARLHAGPLHDGFVAALAENRLLFPRGIDTVFVCGDRIAALPRSTVVKA
jgi:alpha-D-ribose 1-methylphosphonate 5-triphosphate synthase subunit PhnH